MTKPRVLIVEDDPVVANALKEKLTQDGYVVWVASSGQEGLSLRRQIEPDAVILDLVLPDMDGLDVCNEIRRDSVIPLIIASARTSEVDRVCGLELGADDYVCKPFDADELVWRLRALLQRWHRYTGTCVEQDEGVIELGPITIDLLRHEVKKNGRPVRLTPKEFELLVALARRANRTVSSRRLLWDVWGYDENIRTRTLDVHVGRLRKKLEDDPQEPKLIVTVPSVGYRLNVPSAERETTRQAA